MCGDFIQRPALDVQQAQNGLFNLRNVIVWIAEGFPDMLAHILITRRSIGFIIHAVAAATATGSINTGCLQSLNKYCVNISLRPAVPAVVGFREKMIEAWNLFGSRGDSGYNALLLIASM